MRLGPLKRYRPTRTSDGKGGWTAAYSDPETIYASVSVHQNETVLIFRHGEDVRPEDVIEAEGAYYRVTDIVGPVAVPMKRAELQRTEGPITP